MQIAQRLKKGDTVAIISLSSGILGEPFMAQQKSLIEKRIKAFGLKVIYTPHALKGLEFIKTNPKARAADLKWAFAQQEVKLILSAIGGDDTYQTVPYLLEDGTFKKLVSENPKLFMGYSDTSINHLMFQKLGLATYYGPAAIVDFGEFAPDMLAYTEACIHHLFSDDAPEIVSSPTWYHERTEFGQDAFGTDRQSSPETHGYEVLFGSGKISGKLYGGCLESLGELLLGGRYGDEAMVNEAYQLLCRDTRDKLLFLETSEEKPTPERVKLLLAALEKADFFTHAKGLIVGKPQDEAYYDAYRSIYHALAEKYQLPLLYNVNFGHAHPKCILPIGQSVTLDLDAKIVKLASSLAR